MIPVTQPQVEVEVERELTDTESEVLAARVQRASDLVEGYIGVVYGTDNPAPAVVVRVAARVAARTFTVAQRIPDFVDSQSVGMGPFSRTQKFNTDATSGAVWLTKADKAALTP